MLVARTLTALGLFWAISGPLLAAPPHKASPKAAKKVASDPSLPGAAEFHSHYAILVDAVSGKVLWARNAEVKRSIASTTKIMTALLLLEKGNLTDIVTAPKGVDKIEESSLHLSPGETISLHDLLYALLLRSANDAAVTGATYVSGSVPKFADLMNQRAKELGMERTHYVTPNGLFDKNHYSTAADLAKVAAYAVNTQPVFNEIVKTPRYKLKRSMHVGDVWVINTAKTYLKDFLGADGIKTGYIRQAGHCFVGSATRTDWRLIAVALNSNTCREDVEAMLDYGFANFQPTVALVKGTSVGLVTVPNSAAPTQVEAADDIKAIVSKKQTAPNFQIVLTPLLALPSAPVAAGTRLGTISVLLDGKVQAMGDAIATAATPVKPSIALLHTTKRVGLGALRVISNVLGMLMLLFLGIRIYARTASKGAGRSRDRVAADVRNVD